MNKLIFRLLLVSSILGAVSFGVACKSEIDDKPAATVSDVKADDKAMDDKKDDKAMDDKAMDDKKGDAAAMATTMTLEATTSKIGFIGAKVTGDHKGGFNKFDGTAEMAGGKLTKLMINVETSSIFTDTEKLTGHLMSPDFFDVEKFPKASFNLTEIKDQAGEGGTTHVVSGELDMHGIKKQISFPATLKAEGDTASAKADFKINRKDFGIVYAGKPDDLIKDDVALQLELNFKKG